MHHPYFENFDGANDGYCARRMVHNGTILATWCRYPWILWQIWTRALPFVDVVDTLGRLTNEMFYTWISCSQFCSISYSTESRSWECRNGSKQHNILTLDSRSLPQPWIHIVFFTLKVHYVNNKAQHEMSLLRQAVENSILWIQYQSSSENDTVLPQVLRSGVHIRSTNISDY